MTFNEYAFSFEVAERKVQLEKVSCMEELKIEKLNEKARYKKDKIMLSAIPFLQFEKSCCCI